MKTILMPITEEQSFFLLQISMKKSGQGFARFVEGILEIMRKESGSWGKPMDKDKLKRRLEGTEKIYPYN